MIYYPPEVIIDTFDIYLVFQSLITNSKSAVLICLVQFSRSVMSDSFDPMNRNMPGLPVHHKLPEFTQTHVH